MSLYDILDNYEKEVVKAKETYKNSLNKINVDIAESFNLLPIDVYKNLSLNELYELLHKIYWSSEKRVNEIIDIIEDKKLEQRKKEGFVLYKRLNDNINLSNDLKIKIEDKLIEALKVKKYLKKDFFLNLKLSNNDRENNEIWNEIIDVLYKTSCANISYEINCLDKDCGHTIIRFEDITVFWADKIIKNIDKFKETNELKYKDEAYHCLERFIFLEDDYACPKCFLDFELDDIYDDLKNIRENQYIIVFEPRDKFYPINKNKIKII